MAPELFIVSAAGKNEERGVWRCAFEMGGGWSLIILLTQWQGAYWFLSTLAAACADFRRERQVTQVWPSVRARSYARAPILISNALIFPSQILHEYSRPPCLSGRLSRYHLFRWFHSLWKPAKWTRSVNDNPDTMEPHNTSLFSFQASDRQPWHLVPGDTLRQVSALFLERLPLLYQPIKDCHRLTVSAEVWSCSLWPAPGAGRVKAPRNASEAD